MLQIVKFINEPVSSNCFIVYDDTSLKALIIDPGFENGLELFEFINDINIIPEYIILTHEHFDHIWGVNKLKDMFSTKTVCSAVCAEHIINPRKNFSIFYNQVGFAAYAADIVLEKFPASINWGNYAINFLYTPGHSEGSICFNIDNYLFTGDTLIKNEKTLIKLLGGNKQKLRSSLELLFELFTAQTVVFPGHGAIFQLGEVNIDEAC